MTEIDLTAQALSFAPVLPPEGQPEAVTRDDKGNVLVTIRADQANKVTMFVDPDEYAFEKLDNGLWQLKFPKTSGFNCVEIRIDGTGVIIPYLPVVYGYSRPYNSIMLEEADGDFYRLKDVPHGTVRRDYFFSATTGEWASCLVYTPPGYDQAADRSYPVLYLQHGHGENETGWINSGKANLILDNLIAEGKAVPFVIVMNNGMVQIDRGGKRIVDHLLFEDFLLNDVMPFIERNYRVSREKNGRAIAGLSMGSIQTSIISLKHWELFSHVGLFSGFMHDFLQGSPLDMLERAPSKNEHLEVLDHPDALRCRFKLFFRGIGQDDALYPAFEADDRFLAEQDIETMRVIYPGIHDWNVWRRCLRDFAQLLFIEENVKYK